MGVRIWPSVCEANAKSEWECGFFEEKTHGLRSHKHMDSDKNTSTLKYKKPIARRDRTPSYVTP